MRTEVLQIDDKFGREYAGTYVMSEISWAKRSRIIQKHTKYSQITGQVVNSDYVAIQAETVWASLKEQPANKPITLEKLLGDENGIPVGLGEVFSQVANRLNSIGLEETRFLSEQYADSSPTKLSQSSACARSSDGPQISLPDNRQEPSSSSSPYSTS